jgi:hypothetical protein
MANYYFSSTGTRVAGASTVDDWSNANCYPQGNIASIVEADGDTYVFDELLSGLGVTTYTASAEIAFIKAVTVSTRFGASGGGAKLTRTSGGTLMSLNPDSVAVTTVNDVILEGPGVTSSSLTLSSSTVSKVIVLNRVKFLNSPSAGHCITFSQENGSVTMNNIEVSGSITNSFLFGAATLGTNAAMSVTINGVYFNSVTATAAASIYGILLRKGNFANNVSIDISNVTGSLSAISANGAPQIIQVQGCQEPKIHDNNYTVSNISVVTCYGINAYGLDAVNRVTNRPKIYRNTVNFYCRSGDAISAGQDSETGLGYTTNARIYRNIVSGQASTADTPHGIALRGVASGRVFANKIKRIHSPLMLSLCTNDNAMAYGNLITDVYGVGISYKGNSGGQMHNNTVIVTLNSIDGATTKPYGIWVREQGAVANSASKCYNNSIIYLGMTKTGMFVLVDTADACTFSNNNYYTDQTLPADAWSYTGTAYANLAAWNAAQETTDATGNAIFTATIAEITAAFGDLDANKYMATAANYGGGQKWFATNEDMEGANAQPFPSFNIDKGGCPSNVSPWHPRNL